MSGHRVLQDLVRAAYESLDPGQGKALQVDRSYVYFPLVSVETETSAAKKRTLPAPAHSGLVVFVGMQADGGDCLLTVTGGFDAAGNTDMTFNDVGDWVMLVSVVTGKGVYAWRVVQSQGISGIISTVAASTSVAAGAGTATMVFKASDATTPTLTSTGWLPVTVNGTVKYIPYFDATK